MRFEGIYTPVITPHRPNCEIDRDNFGVVIEHLIESGVHGIVTAGTTGEYYAQTRDERLMLMNLAYEVIKGRVPMIAGVGAIRTEDCITLKTLWIDTSDRELDSGIA